jgi:hypothetical protein
MPEKKEKFMKFCLQCGSTNVKAWAPSFISINPQYICIDCNTVGFPMEGNEAMIIAFRKKIGAKKSKANKKPSSPKSNRKAKGKSKTKR